MPSQDPVGNHCTSNLWAVTYSKQLARRVLTARVRELGKIKTRTETEEVSNARYLKFSEIREHRRL